MEKREVVAVSACLLGLNCKYNGKNNGHPLVMDYIKGKHFIAVCPECFGGLLMPRQPAEIQGGTGKEVWQGKAHVMSKDGEDWTAAFQKGAESMLQLCKLAGVTSAVLKENSPSCGVTFVYDGTFSGTKIPGKGVFAEKLEALGIEILSEKML